MFHNDIAVKILDCFVYNQPKGTKYNTARNYCALAYRVDTPCKYIYSEKTLSVPKGSLIFVPNGINYDTISDKGRIYALHFNILNHSYDDIELISNDVSINAKDFFEECIRRWEEKKPGYQYKITSMFYKLLEAVTKSNISLSDKKVAPIEICIEYINNNFTNQDLTISAVAENANISEGYIRRIFQKKLGIGPQKYLTNKRIQYAKYLIDTGYFSQKEIAQKCGFTDVKYFRYVFKQTTGITVNVFKNQKNSQV